MSRRPLFTPREIRTALEGLEILAAEAADARVHSARRRELQAHADLILDRLRHLWSNA